MLSDAEVVALWYFFMSQFPKGVLREGISGDDMIAEVDKRDNIVYDSDGTVLKNTDGELLAPTVPK